MQNKGLSTFGNVMRPSFKLHTVVVILALWIGLSISCSVDQDTLKPFPAGYIDSPFIVPDGSTLYFIHSVVSTKDILTGNPDARPVTDFLPGHQGQDGPYWWNTDIYVSHRNPDGTWGKPQNLGPPINTEHMECCVWVNQDQTVLIFTRESVNDPSQSGSFISRRNSKNEPWGNPQRLPGILGDYQTYGFTDFHLSPAGNLYFWAKTTGDGVLYWARNLGPNSWSNPAPLPQNFQTSLDETQPWVNDSETIIYFNRRGEDGNTELWTSTRTDPSVPWGTPQRVSVLGFADENGYRIWGEPSFTHDGKMFFVRFNTATKDWDAELMFADQNADGRYGPPEKLIFRMDHPY